MLIPLQIGALKDKLREADSLLREHERRQSDSLLGADTALAAWLRGQTSVEAAMASLVDRAADPGLDSGSQLYVSLLSARFRDSIQIHFTILMKTLTKIFTKKLSKSYTYKSKESVVNACLIFKFGCVNFS